MGLTLSQCNLPSLNLPAQKQVKEAEFLRLDPKNPFLLPPPSLPENEPILPHDPTQFTKPLIQYVPQPGVIYPYNHISNLPISMSIVSKTFQERMKTQGLSVKLLLNNLECLGELKWHQKEFPSLGNYNSIIDAISPLSSLVLKSGERKKVIRVKDIDELVATEHLLRNYIDCGDVPGYFNTKTLALVLRHSKSAVLISFPSSMDAQLMCELICRANQRLIVGVE